MLALPADSPAVASAQAVALAKAGG